jgi:hypothetical protein
MIKSRKFQKGIRTKPTTDAATLEGEQRTDSADNKQKIFLDSAERAVVTEDQSQDLSNKSIDADNNTISNLETDNLKAGVLNTDLSGAATDTEIPSALAVKTALEGQNEASEINYDNSTSGLAATDVQAAIDEVEGRLDSSETALSDHLVDAVDAHDASAISNAPTGNLVATDVQGALDELQTEIDALPAKSETLQNKTLDSSNTISGSIETPTRLDVKQDTEANLITYAATASDGQLCFATDTLKMYQVITNELQPVGGGGSTSFEITQAAHGLTVGSGIFHNGTIYVDAQANADTTLAYHVVVEVIDANTFVAADFGRIEVPSHGFTIGQYYFQSEATAGLPTTTQPVSGYSNPLFYVETADILQIKCLRPSPVGDTINLDELADVSIPAPTDGQALIYNLANLRWEATDVAGTAADITYSNATSGLTATNTQAAIDEVEARVDTLEAFTPELDGLSDVTITARKDGQVLKYDEAADQMINAPISFNMLANHEDMTPTLTSVTATKDAAVFLPIDVNTQSMRITFAGSAGSYLQEAPLNSELDGLQGVLRAWVKTDQDNVELSSTIDGVAQSTVTVISTNKWRQYEIPIVMSGTNMGIQISSASSITGNIYLDQVELEIAKASQELGTAHFVGSLVYKDAGCTVWNSVNPTSFTSFPVNALCPASEIIGSVQAPDTRIPAVKIPNARTDGYYSVIRQGLNYMSSGSSCRYILSAPENSDIDQGQVYVDATSNADSTTRGDFRFTTIGDKTVEVKSIGTSSTCQAYGNSSAVSKFTVHFFPDSKNTIAVQKSQSPNYAGFLSFSFMDGDLQGHLPADGRCVAKNLYPDYDKRVANLYGDCDSGTGANTGYNLPDMRGYFPRMVDTTSEGTAGVNPDNTVLGGKQEDQNLSHNHQTTAGPLGGGIGTRLTITNVGDVSTYSAGATPIQTDFRGGNEARPSAISLMAYVRMSDNNLVVGTFEQIRSDDLIYVGAAGNTANTITAATEAVDFLEVNDDSNSWIQEGAHGTDTFVAPKDGVYRFDGSVYLSSTASSNVYLYIDGILIKSLGYNITHRQHPFSGSHPMIAGQKATIRINVTQALTNNPAEHWLSITQQATKESIVANLMQGQTTKCQTKFLSADVTANGTVTDLGFNNLSIGDKYEICYRGDAIFGTPDNIGIRYEHDGSIISSATISLGSVGGASVSQTYTCFKFTATASTLINSIISLNPANTIRGNGTADETYAQLCELPDTVIFTDEFD